MLALYGPQPQVLPGWLETPGFQLGPVYLDSQYLVVIAATLALVGFQYWLFERTLLGKKLQATSQDKEMAALLGIHGEFGILIYFTPKAAIPRLDMIDNVAEPSLAGHPELVAKIRAIVKRARAAIGRRQ